jgi:hypothetical protein
MAEPIPRGGPVGSGHVTVPAAWALRIYWGSTLLLVGTTAAALGAVLPVAALLRLVPSGTAPRLHPWMLSHVSYGSLWDANAQTPAILQQIAVNVALELLVAAGVAVLAVAGLTVLTLFAARAAQRTREVAVRRAVGASRRALLAASLLEGAAILALGLVIGSAVGTIGARAALITWPGLADPARWSARGIVVIALSATVLAGTLIPALAAPRRRLVERATLPVPLALPAIQLGLSLLVLAVGAHLTRHSAGPTPSARAPDGGEVFAATPAEARPADRAAMYAALLQQLAHRPEFDSVSLTSPGAVAGLGTVAVVTTLCGYCAEGGIRAPWHYESAAHEFVSADSFKALGVHVLAGRGITTAAPASPW